MAKQGKIELKSYSVSEEVFDKLLTAEFDVKLVESKSEFDSYKFGYPQKPVFMYNGFDQIICLEWVLGRYTILDDKNPPYWMQCIVSKNKDQKDACLKSITGGVAYRVIKSRIRKYYTEAEYEMRLRVFEADYDDEKKQFHYELFEEANKIIKYENCYKFDINGAHNDALKVIFPRAAHEFDELYKNRKVNPINKQYVNFYVGMLCCVGHRKTYNWIVQRTNALLTKGMDYCGGRLLYANTDGFLVQDPDRTLTHSTTLGDFKLEYEGETWFYYDKNYFCIQYDKPEGKEITGSVLYSVRDKIDLKNGKVVHYDRIKTKDDVYIAENIKEEQI